MGDGPGRGLPERFGARHAFVRERVLALVGLSAAGGDGAVLGKREMAEALGTGEESVERALRRLRREGLLESVARHAPDGAQLSNEYRLTESGRALARLLGVPDQPPITDAQP